jgi:hypothetical protein
MMDAREAIEQWRNSIPEEERTEATAGVAMLGVGIVAAALLALRRRRGLFVWLIPGAFIGVGLAVLADVILDTRSYRIAETEDVIASELANLDPIARAQVLKSVSEREVKSLLPGRG